MKVSNTRLVLIAGIVAAMPNFVMAQWTPPTIYFKGVSDQWQTRNSDGSGYDYNLSLQRQAGGTETRFWIPSYQFRNTYHTYGWYDLYWTWQWAGTAYQFKRYQNDTWQCCAANLSWGYKQRLRGGQQGYAFWRSRDTWLEIATGGSERESKYLLLWVTGFAYTDWANGVNGPGPTGAGSPLTWDQLTISGGSLNPDFRRFRKVTANSTVDATPTSGATSYGFDVIIDDHKLQTLTVSRHPNANNRDWQTAFDIGSDALGKDDDGNGNTGSLEDQGCYIEFLIKPAANQTFTAAYQGDEYNNVRNDLAATRLAAAPFANLKTVNSIQITKDGVTIIYDGWANDIPGIGAALTAGAHAIAGVHEYGHLSGLNHRGEGNNIQGYDPANAIMGTPLSAGAREVNGYEVGYFEGSSIPPLGL